MILINGLKFKSFADFDDMYMKIYHNGTTSRLPIPTLVYNMVLLEQDQARLHEVTAWIDGQWFPTIHDFDDLDDFDDFDNFGNSGSDYFDSDSVSEIEG